MADQANVYTVEQVSQLLYTCKKEEPSIFLAMLFAVTAGLRISETIAIKYSNIDFLNNKLSVESQLGRTITNEGIPGENLLIQEKRTKTHNSVREVPLADFVIDEVILQRQHYNTLKQCLGDDFHDLGLLYARTMVCHGTEVLRIKPTKGLLINVDLNILNGENSGQPMHLFFLNIM